MKKILFVDDDPNILDAFKRQLYRKFEVETATGPIDALDILRANPDDFAVVVADMRMPELNGVEFLAKVKQSAPFVVRMMLTGNADQATAIEGINTGCIFRFLNKPCQPEALIEALKAGLRQNQLLTTEHDLLDSTLNGAISVLTEILSLSDPKSFSQAQALRGKMRQLARYLELEHAWQYEIAAALCPIGQVTIPHEVLLKLRVGQTLNPKEQELLRKVPFIGSNLISHIPRLEEVCKIILYQNKRFDGQGYPEDTVAGENIPVGARMFKTLNDLSLLEAEGHFGNAALEKLRARAGWYDPHILDAVAACFRIESPPVGHDGKPSIPVSFNGLRVGHVLVSDIETKDAVLIVSKGNHITQALMHRLRNFFALSGIKEPIYVEQRFWPHGEAKGSLQLGG